MAVGPERAEQAGRGRHDSLRWKEARFENCIAQAPWTKPSVPSIFTSLDPLSHGVLHFADRLPAAATTLAEVFRETGFATLGFSSIHYVGRFSGLHQGLEVMHEAGSLTDQASSKSTREFVDRLLPWLETHRDLPFFVVLHVLDAHHPLEPRAPWEHGRSMHGQPVYGELTRVPLIGRFPQPSALRSDVPKGLEHLLLALLDLDPAKRPAASLARQRAGFPMTGRAVSRPRVHRGARTVARSNSRRDWGAVTGTIAIVALIATLGFLQPWQWLRSRSPVRVDPNVEAPIEESADSQVMVPLAPTAEESANPPVEPPAEQREEAPADRKRAAGEQLRRPELSQVTKNPNGENTLAEDIGGPELERSAPAPFVVEITVNNPNP